MQMLIKLNGTVAELTQKVDDIRSKLIDMCGEVDNDDPALPDGIDFPLKSTDDLNNLEEALQERNIRHNLVRFYSPIMIIMPMLTIQHYSKINVVTNI